MKRPKREVTVFGISALDLFASAMGAFIIIAVILFPYFMNVSEAEARLEEAQHKLDRVEKALAAAEAEAARQTTQAESAEEAAKQAANELAKAEAEREAAAAGGAQIATNLQGCEKHRAARKIKDLDLVLVIDTTGSMEDVIATLRDDLNGIVRVLSKAVTVLHIGVVAYRDEDHRHTSYVTKQFELTLMDGPGLRRTLDFISRLDLAGGETWAEAVEQGIAVAVKMRWHVDTRRHIVVIGDAAAHDENWSAAFSLVDSFVAGPVPSRVSAIYTEREHPLATPIEDRQFFQQLARHGGGEFVDHEGRMMESVLLSAIGR